MTALSCSEPETPISFNASSRSLAANASSASLSAATETPELPIETCSTAVHSCTDGTRCKSAHVGAAADWPDAPGTAHNKTREDKEIDRRMRPLAAQQFACKAT